MKVNANDISIFWSRYEWNPFAGVNKWFCPIHKHDVCFRIKIAHREANVKPGTEFMSAELHTLTHTHCFVLISNRCKALHSSSVLLFLSTFNCEHTLCSRFNRAKQQILIVAFINKIAQCTVQEATEKYHRDCVAYTVIIMLIITMCKIRINYLLKLCNHEPSTAATIKNRSKPFSSHLDFDCHS